MTEQKIIITNKPQINVSIKSSARMRLISLCALLCIIQSAAGDGGRSLILAVTSLVTALISEFLFTWRVYGAGKIKDGSAAVTALILTILLPNQISPVYAVLGVLFAIIVVKHSFGGLGANWLNPALGGWLFIRFSWYNAFTNALAKGSVSIGESNIASNLSALDNSAAEYLNNAIFSRFNANLPGGYIDLLFNNNSSVIADRGLLFLLIGAILITAAKINHGLGAFIFLLIYGFLIRIAGDISGILWNGDIIYGFFSGGTIAAALILTSEPSSGTGTKSGKIFLVVFSAILAWLFRYVYMDYTGCFIAIALVNCFAPVIRVIEEKLIFFRNGHKKLKENIQ